MFLSTTIGSYVFLTGIIRDHEILMEEIEKVDVVISMVGGEHIAN